jgi:prepilin-type N-terminal cleavage/methylation domain-containing protein
MLLPLSLSRQTGFTLIELIMVIVILGILSVVAIPKYISLSADANTAAVSGVAGALASANVVNYAARSENAANGVPIANCTSVSGALTGGLPTGYTITAAAVAVNTTVSCTLTGPSGATATFSATGIN